ncbi:MAG: type II secretion system secretin GspD [Planctomycetes bacterium]|nr:type II secretion system secretin GspD [Planctomycetota bacterium]
MNTSKAATIRRGAKTLCGGILTVVLAAAAYVWAAAPAGNSLPRQPVIEMPFLKEPGAADRLIALDFNQADIRIFIKTVGQLTGINFLVDDKIQGTVTLISPTKIRLGEVYQVFESVLQTKGFAAVPVGSLVKIVPRAEGVKSNVPIRIGCDPDAIPVNDSLVTQILPLRHADVTQVSTVISTLISTGGQVVAFPETNTIILTDSSASVHRVATIVRGLDIEGPQDSIEVIPLKYASASKTCECVTQILQRNTGPARTRRPGTPAQEAAAAAPMRILPDERTNSVVVVSRPEEVVLVKEIITRLDVERPLEASNIHVIYLEHAEAKELEKAVSTALGKITAGVSTERSSLFQITSDESTNSLIVVSSPQDYQLVEEMVKKLDIVREQVLVEFQIIEASDNVLKELGFDWATLDQAVAGSVRGFAATNLGPRVEAASGDLQGVGVGLWKEVDGKPQIGAILKALETNSAVNILSTPHVLTSNHQEATITVADNVPYVSQSRVTEFDPATPTAIRTFDFKDVGIILKVRPHVSGTLVRMAIEATFSKLIQGTTVTDSQTPTTAKREAKTVIAITSGSTVVLGGLMRDDKENVQKKVPLLGDLPLVGALFRSQSTRLQKTNLLLFITPHVLADGNSLDQMSERKRQEQNTHETSGSKR